jgi:tRNA nucleotidyltransferase/poly(A) polymerase
VRAPRARVPVPAAAARFLKPLAEEARRQRAPLYVVGGPVRDWLLERETFDLDLAVAGDPDPVADLCARLIEGRVEPFGRFGTRRVVGRGKFRVDVATTRAEAYAEPAALPELTETGVPIEQDLLRRDFAINAMAARVDDGSYALVDPYDGARDLKEKVLRVLHGGSFRDDPTRVFRAARFLGRLGYHPDAELLRQAEEALASGAAGKLSPHRLLHELTCLLGEKDPFPAFHLLGEWGYLPFLLVGPALRSGLDARALPRGAEERLLWLTLSLGPVDGRVFADYFPFPHDARRRLHEALALALSDASPRTELDPLVRAAVARAFPDMSPAALKPCFLGGADLIARGLKPGPAFHEVLNEAARLQRRGELKSRAAALAWLKKRRPA